MQTEIISTSTSGAASSFKRPVLVFSTCLDVWLSSTMIQYDHSSTEVCNIRNIYLTIEQQEIFTLRPLCRV